MHRKQQILFAVIGFFVVLTALPLFVEVFIHAHERPVLFFQDLSIPGRIVDATSRDHDSSMVFISRMFHNKVYFSINNILTSLVRSLDPRFFYSLSTGTLLPAIQFPLAVVAVITIIRRWDKVKLKYKFLIPMLITSLVVTGIFLPYTALLKLLPLIIAMQIITTIGIYELLAEKLWQKK